MSFVLQNQIHHRQFRKPTPLDNIFFCANYELPCILTHFEFLSTGTFHNVQIFHGVLGKSKTIHTRNIHHRISNSGRSYCSSFVPMGFSFTSTTCNLASRYQDFRNYVKFASIQLVHLWYQQFLLLRIHFLSLIFALKS